MKTFFRIIFLIIVCFFTGCADMNDVVPSEVMEREINISVLDQIYGYNQEMFGTVLVNGSLYYWNGDWNGECRRWNNISIYRKQQNEMTVEKIVDLENRELVCFIVDMEENLYYLYKEYTDDEDTLFFRKLSAEGNEIYNNAVVAAEEVLQKGINDHLNGYNTQGTVSSDGQVCFIDAENNLYLFDENGQYHCLVSNNWMEEWEQSSQKGIVNAGKKGIYTYAVVDTTLLLRNINMADGSLGKIVELEIDTENSFYVFDGYDRGILISDNSNLWQFDCLEEELTYLLKWEDVNLKNYEITLISFLENGTLYVMANSGQGMELVHIDSIKESEHDEKETIIMGTYESLSRVSDLEMVVAKFNKYSQDYQMEIKYYDEAQELYLELLKGKGPDAFQMIYTSVLATKGVLEDLSPYFAESIVVKESDLLLSAREAGYKDGKLLYIFSEFQLRGLITEQGITDKGTWTPEEFLELGEKYPDALLNCGISPDMILRYAISADMDSFIDWEHKECYFDSGRFAAILESVYRVTYQKQVPDLNEWAVNSSQWLYDKEILTEYFQIGDVRRFIEYIDAYGDFAEFAGYPNSKGKPYYFFIPDYVFGMNSASNVKDGVWAFMEFLLSKDYQSTVTNFPVREDIFTAYVSEQISDWKFRRESSLGKEINDMNLVSKQVWNTYPEITEADEELLNYIVENAQWNTSLDDIYGIIQEDTGAFWSGDKTAEEVAEVIQSRVAIYLDEL